MTENLMETWTTHCANLFVCANVMQFGSLQWQTILNWELFRMFVQTCMHDSCNVEAVTAIKCIQTLLWHSHINVSFPLFLFGIYLCDSNWQWAETNASFELLSCLNKIVIIENVNHWSVYNKSTNLSNELSEFNKSGAINDCFQGLKLKIHASYKYIPWCSV